MDRYPLSRKTFSGIKIPKPEGLDYLPFQYAGIEYAVNGQHTLIADPPGLGKTIQAIGFLNYKNIRFALIICPASLVDNWAREVAKWHVGHPIIQKIRKGTDKINNESTIVICSYNMLVNAVFMKELHRFEFTAMILDEVHFLKNPKAKRTKAILGKKGFYKNVDHVIALSGTPIVNKPIELWPILNAISPESIGFKDMFSYGLRYCSGWKGNWGWDFSGASNMDELGKNLRTHIMVRRNKEEVLTDLPDKFMRVIHLDEDAESRRIVKRMGRFDAEEIMKAGGISAQFDELSTLRRELGENKVESAVKYILDQIESGVDKIITFAHHKSVIRALETVFMEKKIKFVTIAGDTPVELRQGYVDQFQNDPETTVIIGSITAMGVGYTLTVSSYVCFVEWSYVPGENKQAIDRAHRIGQKDNVLVDYLSYKDSLDENILQANIRKMKVIDKVMAD